MLHGVEAGTSWSLLGTCDRRGEDKGQQEEEKKGRLRTFPLQATWFLPPSSSQLTKLKHRVWAQLDMRQAEEENVIGAWCRWAATNIKNKRQQTKKGSNNGLPSWVWPRRPFKVGGRPRAIVTIAEFATYPAPSIDLSLCTVAQFTPIQVFSLWQLYLSVHLGLLRDLPITAKRLSGFVFTAHNQLPLQLSLCAAVNCQRSNKEEVVQERMRSNWRMERQRQKGRQQLLGRAVHFWTLQALLWEASGAFGLLSPNSVSLAGLLLASNFGWHWKLLSPHGSFSLLPHSDAFPLSVCCTASCLMLWPTNDGDHEVAFFLNTRTSFRVDFAE